MQWRLIVGPVEKCSGCRGMMTDEAQGLSHDDDTNAFTAHLPHVDLHMTKRTGQLHPNIRLLMLGFLRKRTIHLVSLVFLVHGDERSLARDCGIMRLIFSHEGQFNRD